MNLGGWIFMILSWTGILSLIGFCLWRAHREPEDEL